MRPARGTLILPIGLGLMLGQVVVFIVLGVSVHRHLERAGVASADVIRALVVGGLLALVITAAATALASRSYRRQIARIGSSATRIASGDRAHRLGPRPTRELTALAESLNRMAEQLGDRTATTDGHRSDLSVVLDSMGHGLIALDADQRIVEHNRQAARMLNLANTANGRLLHEVVREPDLHRIMAATLTGAGDNDPTIIAVGGGQTELEVRCRRMQSGDGSLRGLMLIFEDVTDHHRFESLRSDFAANVSHELRTPITNIKGYIETLRDVGWHDAEQADRFLDVIGTNSNRLAAIVEDVMMLTRLQQPSRDALETTPTLVVELLNRARSQFSSAAAEKSITVEVEAPGDLLIAVHAPLLEQAVGNLLSNAITYSPAGTTVTIAAGEHDRTARLTVSDQGAGIAPEHHERLFERFYRVDKARRAAGGTGLGLAIVKHIAQLHGGHAEVESATGGGSVFSIVLPQA